MMTGDDAWIARVAAALCVSARWVIGVSMAVSLVAMAGLLGHASDQSCIAASLVALCAPLQAYYGVRLELDAAVFKRLAEDPEEVAGFDAAMTALRWMAPRKAGRPFAERAAGARSLLQRALLVLALQVVGILVAAALR